MAEGLQTADGQAVTDVPPAGGTDEDLQRQFAAAMAAPEPTDATAPAPPKVNPADPDAPYGRTQDGKPKKGPGGRPPKRSRPRTEPAPAAAAAVPRNYGQDLAEFGQGVWFLMASIPATQAQACIFKTHMPGLVNGWAAAAERNATIRAGVEFLTGSGTWVAAVAMATVPFVMQSLALWTGQVDEELVKRMADSTMADMEAIAQQQAQAFAAATQQAA